MDDKYKPQKCGASQKVYGVYICDLQATPCALHKGEKCYAQVADETIARIVESWIDEIKRKME